MGAIQSPRKPQECWSFFASIQEREEGEGGEGGEGGVGPKARGRGNGGDRERKGKQRHAKVETVVCHATQLQTSSRGTMQVSPNLPGRVAGRSCSLL